ncbi:CRISPR-associated endonuclease Cas2 [Thermodesulfovibrio sp. 3462-1]|uniref:CRISPR-associated endonuclease Cas2 n=1 Tax=Thermodesulfovibrio obliviosus TaxID=3118332 RepID=A0AAU8H3W9_9BACT
MNVILVYDVKEERVQKVLKICRKYLHDCLVDEHFPVVARFEDLQKVSTLGAEFCI